MLKVLEKVSGQSLPRITPVQIICGDCAGEKLFPIRTNQTATGVCAVCGGRSFVLASLLCDALARHLVKQKSEVNK